MTKPKLPIKLGVEQSIAGDKDVNRLSCVRPELGEFAILFITVRGLAIVPPSKPIKSRRKADWWHFAKPMLPAVYLKFREA